MATFLSTAECTRYCTEGWKEWHMGRWFVLGLGFSMAIFGFFLATKKQFSEFEVLEVCACFVCAGGILMIICALTYCVCCSVEETESSGNSRRHIRSPTNEYMVFYGGNQTSTGLRVYVNAPSTSGGLFNEAKTAPPAT